jgi:hypothetical protein
MVGSQCRNSYKCGLRFDGGADVHDLLLSTLACAYVSIVRRWQKRCKRFQPRKARSFEVRQPFQDDALRKCQAGKLDLCEMIPLLTPDCCHPLNSSDDTRKSIPRSILRRVRQAQRLKRPAYEDDRLAE